VQLNCVAGMLVGSGWLVGNGVAVTMITGWVATVGKGVGMAVGGLSPESLPRLQASAASASANTTIMGLA
jgi:hypothetical protein